MEGAIEQAVAYLADHPPKDQEDVSAALSRSCRQELRRRRKERKQFVLIDFLLRPKCRRLIRPFPHYTQRLTRKELSQMPRPQSGRL
jgi:hypothetical protein